MNRKNGALMVNLVNTAGPHSDMGVRQFDEIPVVGPVELTVRCARRPSAVRLQPGNRKVLWKFGSGCVRVKVPCVRIHEILEIMQDDVL